MHEGGDGIPVTILSGPLGAGKTTLLNHLLTSSGDRRIAVLVNDMGEVNVDADLLAAGTDLAADGGVAELSNGCICCELQDDLETEVARLASERDFDVLVVESSGISEPAPVGRLFTTDSRAAAVYDLDALVTVIDAPRFWETFGSETTGEIERVERETPTGAADRPLSDLLIEQVEVANVLLVNKSDLLDDETLERVEALLAALNPDAEIYRTVHSDVDPDHVLETGLFDPADAAERSSWQRALDGVADEHAEDSHDARAGDSDDAHAHGDERDGHDHTHDHADHSHPEAVYGVDSFAYRRREPFHPGRLRDVLTDLPAGVVRSKGLFWALGRDDLALLYSQAGPTGRVEPVGPWIASLPEVERELYRGNDLEVPWDDEVGDRRSELVFIGQGLDEDAIVAALDDALATAAERAAAADEGSDAPADANADVRADADPDALADATPGDDDFLPAAEDDDPVEFASR